MLQSEILKNKSIPIEDKILLVIDMRKYDAGKDPLVHIGKLQEDIQQLVCEHNGHKYRHISDPNVCSVCGDRKNA